MLHQTNSPACTSSPHENVIVRIASNLPETAQNKRLPQLMGMRKNPYSDFRSHTDLK
ncbi:MAG: hypothetical protein WBH50_24260 [Fuerstiella sp.]|jgi:hypothetical protein